MTSPPPVCWVNVLNTAVSVCRTFTNYIDCRLSEFQANCWCPRTTATFLTECAVLRWQAKSRFLPGVAQRQRHWWMRLLQTTERLDVDLSHDECDVTIKYRLNPLSTVTHRDEQTRINHFHYTAHSHCLSQWTLRPGISWNASRRADEVTCILSVDVHVSSQDVEHHPVILDSKDLLTYQIIHHEPWNVPLYFGQFWRICSFLANVNLRSRSLKTNKSAKKHES